MYGYLNLLKYLDCVIIYLLSIFMLNELGTEVFMQMNVAVSILPQWSCIH